MPIAYQPTGRPRGRPRRHAATPGLERANEFLARAARLFEVDVFDISSEGRGSRALVMARALVAHALRVELKWTLQEIADFLGRENHTSVWASVQRTSTRILLKLGNDAELHAQIIAP